MPSVGIKTKSWNTATHEIFSNGAFLTIRNAAAPVRIQSFRLVESTYPVVADGAFDCSDFRLSRIWENAARTLKLCMEDTFTDCPLYEQTLWVGDARSESLFAMATYGAYDLVRRCIRLAGESLDELPLVGSQVPSAWKNIIPVWSFMWNLSVKDYFDETGDAAFLAEVWPMVCKNLDSAATMIDPENGLFRSLEWNLFDWSKTNSDQPILLHNSLFLVGALRATEALASAANDPAYGELCRERREKLVTAINAAWDTRKLAWPDSISFDGTASEDVSIHTSFLALLFDAVDAEREAAVRANTLSPRSELIPVASPFASFYYYQTLEKLGQIPEIIEKMRLDYLPMLESGATTMWETYPGAFAGDPRFPTRSHCHAWSAAPLYFLPKLVLGLIPAENGRRFLVSPWISSLDWAQGSRPTPFGRVEIRWRKTAEKVLEIEVSGPPEVEFELKNNLSLKEWELALSRA